VINICHYCIIITITKSKSNMIQYYLPHHKRHNARSKVTALLHHPLRLIFLYSHCNNIFFYIIDIFIQALNSALLNCKNM